MAAKAKKSGEKSKQVAALRAAKAEKKPAKKKGLKLASNRTSKKEKKAPSDLPPRNHNYGETNPELIELFDKYAARDADKKEIGKEQRDIAAEAKERHGINKANFMHEVKMRKMALDARVMFEQGVADVKTATGFDAALEAHRERQKQAEEEADANREGGEEGNDSNALSGDNSESEEEQE